jgi:hypothetical protein
MIAAQGDTAKGKREPAAEPQTARSARQADPGPGLVPWPHQQAATIGISGNAPRHAAQSALAQSGAQTPADLDGWGLLDDQQSRRTDRVVLSLDCLGASGAAAAAGRGRGLELTVGQQISSWG